MRFWGKMWKDGRLLRDVVVEDYSDETRTHKVMHALYEVCLAFDLGEPIWLDANIGEFRRIGRVRFRQDSFIEEIVFEYLELMVIEED